jgi:formate-dependent nitrite reductase cytochrome c552 subunit
MLSGKPTGTDAVEANIWAVNGVISDTQTINDVLRKGKVECSTCHDPHYKNRTNPDPGFVRSYTNSGDHEDMKIDGLFLRRVGGNSNSGVCRTCHAK